MFAEAIEETGKVATEAASTLAASGPLGAAVVVLLFVVGFLIWKLVVVQDARIADQKEMSLRMERAATRDTEMVNTVVNALSEMKQAVQRLTDTDREQVAALRRLAFEQSTTIREAVKGGDR